MSKVVTISKLEALLSRIRSRAAEPRASSPAASSPVAPTLAAFAPVAPSSATAFPVALTPAVAAASPVAAAAPPAAVAPAMAPPTVPAFVPQAPPIRAAREASPEPRELVQLDEPTLPPPPLVEAAGEADFEIDVDLSPATPEPPAAVAGPETQDATDSREQLSAVPAVSLESAEPGAVDAAPSIEQVEEVNELANEVNEGGIAGDEEDAIEEAPASSRRPVTSPPEGRLADLAFGAEEPQPPRHTPPPKSGRLPAPPDTEFDADVTGVHATPGASRDHDSGPPSVRSPEPSVLVAQAVRATLGSGLNVQVPDVIGEAQRFTPATFLALLDASLAL